MFLSGRQSAHHHIVVMRCVPIKRQRGDDSDMRLVASAVFLFLNEADGARDPEKRGSHKM